jgi:acetyltransferase-like isoleucine patch superfamily enzyme
MVKVLRRVRNLWTRIWMRFAGTGPIGRLAGRMATLFVRPYRGMYYLATLSSRGFISPTARVSHSDMDLGSHIFIGDRVILYQGRDGGPLQIGDDVHVNQDCILETAQGGSIFIGAGSRIQPRCQFSAYLGQILIGRDVQVAPNCAFYPYDHEIAPDLSIKAQPLRTRGGIVIEDDVWLGYNVVVLDGVRIGAGAVIGAGSVVKSNIPSGAIAAGSPARVVKWRDSVGFDARVPVAPKTDSQSQETRMPDK